MTVTRVTRIRISQRPQAGRCNYCGHKHMPPLSYWYAIYAYLAGWMTYREND